MHTKSGMTYWHLVMIAFTVEMVLILLQFAGLRLYVEGHPDNGLVFTSAYVMSTGFYIFLVGGFFLYTIIIYQLLGRITESIVRKLSVFLITGGIIELAFYLSVQAPYEGVFVYSILDKVIAAAFALILFNATTDQKRAPGSYL